jgi:hypothetical protein
MVQRGEGLGLARETGSKFGIAHAFGSKEFKGDKTIQRFLPRLVNNAHSASAKAFEYFQLWKVRRDLLRRQGCLDRSCVVGEGGLRFEVERHEAIWAKAGSLLRR